MFSLKKLVLVTACVALALGPAAVVAETQSAHLRIHIHSLSAKEALVNATAAAASSSSSDGSKVGGLSVGFEDDSDSASASQDDVGDSSDSEEDVCSGEGESLTSVEGAEGVFCVKGQACVADLANGACPGVQKGLPTGAVCGKVQSGVYGCKINTVKHHKKQHHKKQHHHKTTTSAQ